MIVTGEGFAQNSNVVLNGRVLPFQLTGTTKLSFDVPGDMALGPAVLRVETGGGQSQDVRIEVRP